MEERATTSVTPSPFLPFFVGMLNKRVEDNLSFNLDGVDRLQTVSEVNLTLFKALFSLSRKLPDTVRTLSQPSNTFDCEPIHKPIDQDTFFSRISLLLPTQTTRHYTSEVPMPNQEKSVVEKCFDSLKMAVTTLMGKKHIQKLLTSFRRSRVIQTAHQQTNTAELRSLFNLRHFSNIVGGLFRVNQNQIDKDGMIRLSVHECTQTFSDRLVDSSGLTERCGEKEGFLNTFQKRGNEISSKEQL
ncbi:hypothetical protein BLNAU_1574 [Blattamonas nauphoetae]|uniref:Dynein 2 heavy chain 1 cytoplasmic ATPase lid domain-containing protein n=1 Tax=Blattamonas nauphoetae TaxID=2049346 RepID=A0ABQ9XRY7_9EUKA|nr:hypothetical protein BLNAU_11456 [Blattamonas nauphoetae]KAK2963531.1 hypothetical protein BLNAU_1574 [Blattamonas nauphoetae]